MTEERMCTSGDHGDIPAVGEAQVEDDPGWYPYCTECLLLCDPPRRWYGKPPSWALADLSDEVDQQLVRAVEEALLANRQELRDLHHSHASLDANARNLIARIAVNALLERQEDADVEAQIARTKLAATEAERDRLTAEVTTLSIQSMGAEGEYHDVKDERDRLRAAMKYLRAAAHLFPHTNTDRNHELLGLADDAPGAWCLGCTVGATADYVANTDDTFLEGDESKWDERARQWMREYEDRETADG